MTNALPIELIARCAQCWDRTNYLSFMIALLYVSLNLEPRYGVEPSTKAAPHRLLWIPPTPVGLLGIKLATRTGFEPVISHVTGGRLDHSTNEPILLFLIFFAMCSLCIF